MRASLVLFALLAACGTSSGESGSPPPTTGAETAPAPAWHCWADSTYVSDCRHTARECAESAADARDMITTPISCAEQASAWCVTHHLADGEDDTICLASAASCEGMSNDIVATGGNAVTSACSESH